MVNLFLIIRALFILFILPFLRFFLRSDSFLQMMIRCNNSFAKHLFLPKRLLLLPHCLQKDALSRIKSVAEAEGVKIAVVGGGQLAQKIVKENGGSFVIAVACEQELIAGIQRNPFVPILAIWNKRVCGPCTNTFVKEELVKEVLKKDGY